MVTSTFINLFSVKFRRKNPVLFLTASWTVGFIAGSYCSFGAGDSFFSWMRSAEFGSVSIVCLVTNLFLPFLFSAIAVFFRQFWLLFPIAFIKTFLLGFCGAGVMVCCRGAGWLVCFLLLFSELTTLPWLFCFMVRLLRSNMRLAGLELSGIAAFVFLVVSIDRCCITPFLASLL